MTEHFKRAEFACKCGCGLNNISPLLVEKLEKARKRAGVKFAITSGCRCATHNEKVGGVEESSHVYGYAVDIALDDRNWIFIIKALETEFDRIGIAKNFIHVDIDPRKKPARWRY
ncbi:MAG: D-Ala-D-Ala carboxypeptidase family metallohydrolase [Campylobacteraceae bacterium]